VLRPNPGQITILDDSHLVSDFTFENLAANGKKITSRQSANLNTNEFVRDLRFA
jgi:hypothetical protein